VKWFLVDHKYIAGEFDRDLTTSDDPIMVKVMYSTSQFKGWKITDVGKSLGLEPSIFF
jgi:hypothetical protein